MSEVTLVDANVLLDVVTDDPAWVGWSAARLSEALDTGTVVINPIVYAEVSLGFDRIEDLDDALPASHFVREPLPWDGGIPRCQGVRVIPPPRRHADGAAPRLLHRRTRGRVGLPPAHPRPRSLRDVLPDG